MKLHRCVLTGLVFASMTAPHGVFAQSAPYSPDVRRPISDVGGYTGRVMSQIYRESIGRGYSSAELNRMTLSGSRVSLGGAVDPGIRPVQSSTAGFSTLSGAPAAKPFSGVSPSPTVSPYLGLFNDSFDDATNSNYIQFVRPQLEQQRFNRQVQLQQQVLDRRVQEIAAAPAFSPQGSEAQMPTGHPSAFMSTGRYYPLNNYRYRRR